VKHEFSGSISRRWRFKDRFGFPVLPAAAGNPFARRIAAMSVLRGVARAAGFAPLPAASGQPNPGRAAACGALAVADCRRRKKRARPPRPASSEIAARIGLPVGSRSVGEDQPTKDEVGGWASQSTSAKEAEERVGPRRSRRRGAGFAGAHLDG